MFSQTTPPVTSGINKQLVYLDFDGDSTFYINRDLNLNISVDVQDSGIDQSKQQDIVIALNEKYQDSNVFFTAVKPTDETEYSTVFIGKTNDFDSYGSFAGLAETIDKGNKIKNDNAFVFADDSFSTANVINVIDHEIGHIVNGEEHIQQYGNIRDYAASVIRETTDSNPKDQGTYNGPYYLYDKLTIHGHGGGSGIGISGTNYGSSYTKLNVDTDGYTISVFTDTIYCRVTSSSVSGGELVVYDASYSYEFGVMKNFILHGQQLYNRETFPISGLRFGQKINFVVQGTIGSSAGDYTLEIFTADSNNSSNNSNNNSNNNTSYGKADLKTTALTYTRNSREQELTLNFTIANLGKTTAGDNTVYIYDGNKVIGSQFFYALTNGYQRSLSYTIDTKNLATGTHTFKVAADALKQVSETNENNNYLTKTVNITRDLQLSALSYRLNSSRKTLTLNFTVANRGNTAVKSSKVYIYDGNKRVGTMSLASFAAGEKRSFSYSLNSRKLANGTHNFKVVADAAKAVTETNENNNFLTKSFHASRDLRVSALTYKQNSKQNTLKLNFTIANKGNTAAGASKAYIYDGKKLVGTMSLASFAAGTKRSFSYSLDARKLTSGTHNFKVVADAAKAVAEINKSNNSRSKSVKITKDMQVSSLTYKLDSKQNTLKLNFTIANKGNTAAGASKAYIYDGSKRIGTMSLASFAAGEKRSFSYSLNTGKLTPGTHNFKVVADATKTVSETNESNNSRSKSVKISRIKDLQVSALTFTSNTDKNILRLNFTIANKGNTAAGASKAYIYDGKKLVGTMSLASFASGEKRSFSYSLDTRKLTNGTHNFKVVADATGQIAESNEKNNSLTVSAKIAKCDLEVSSLWLYDYYYRDGSVEVDFFITNNNNNTAAPSVAYIYDGEKKIGEIAIRSIYAFGSTYQTFKIDPGVLAPGTHNIKVVADGAKKINESNENNNITVKSITLDAPDLIIVNGCYEKTVNGVTTIHFTVQNKTWGFAPASQAFIYDGNSKIGVVDVGSLLYRERKSYSFDITGNWSGDVKNLTVVANGRNDIVESNLNNNTGSITELYDPVKVGNSNDEANTSTALESAGAADPCDVDWGDDQLSDIPDLSAWQGIDETPTSQMCSALPGDGWQFGESGDLNHELSGGILLCSSENTLDTTIEENNKIINTLA